jgi:hypothetical protein
MDHNELVQVSAQKPKIRKGVIFLLLAALVSLACLCSTQNLPPFLSDLVEGNDNTSANDAVTAENILLQDDFSDPNSGWEVAEFDSGDVGYVDGTYFVTSLDSGGAMWGQAGQNYTDVSIEVTASQFSGPDNDNNDYGVMCRLNDSGGGYSFNVSGDGFYSIQRMDDSSFTNLVDWTESNEINQGNATNEVRGVCQGSTLTLYVNGEKLAEATDTTYTSGDIALAATTYEDEPTEVRFDNLVVSQP